MVSELTNYAGADDVIVAVGARQVIADAQSLVGRGAVLNLFGGLKKGEDTVGFETSLVHYKEINITGSSGGSPWDVARTLELMAAREIDAGDHIARIGDLAHAAEFLQMIKAQAIDGKAVPLTEQYDVSAKVCRTTYCCGCGGIRCASAACWCGRRGGCCSPLRDWQACTSPRFGFRSAMPSQPSTRPLCWQWGCLRAEPLFISGN